MKAKSTANTEKTTTRKRAAAAQIKEPDPTMDSEPAKRTTRRTKNIEETENQIPSLEEKVFYQY
jgi:hypothetical protein